jgi:hypothetical protein
MNYKDIVRDHYLTQPRYVPPEILTKIKNPYMSDRTETPEEGLLVVLCHKAFLEGCVAMYILK